MRHLLASILITGFTLLATAACSDPGQSPATGPSSAGASDSPATECSELSASDLSALRQLQEGIDFDVLVPACVPPGFHLDPAKLRKPDPVATATSTSSHPEIMGTYDYTLTAGSHSIRFAGNLVGNVGGALRNDKQVRGQDAVVYSEKRMDSAGGWHDVPFEESGFYYVSWNEGIDYPDLQDPGIYVAHTSDLSWPTLLPVIESMRPIRELAPEQEGEPDTADTQEGPTGPPTLTVLPVGGACVNGAIELSGSGMPAGAVTLSMMHPGASGYNDASLGVTTADRKGIWSLSTRVPAENRNHWQDRVTVEPTYNNYGGNQEWFAQAVGADGTTVKGTLIVLKCLE